MLPSESTPPQNYTHYERKKKLYIMKNIMTHWRPHITNITTAFNLGVLAWHISNASTPKPQHTELGRKINTQSVQIPNIYLLIPYVLRRFCMKMIKALI